MNTIIPLADGECYLREHFLSALRADRFFETIYQTAEWQQPRVNMFGKSVGSPRLAAWYGNPDAVYTYSGLVNTPLPWFATLQKLRSQVEAYTGARFNSVLLNLYRSGDDAMGWHADDESELAQDAAIASLSLGASRRFLMRHKRRQNGTRMNLTLHHGSLLVMLGETQRHWQHAVPRTRKAVGARINLTFRLVRNSAVAASQ